MSPIVKMLIMSLIIGAIGHVTSQLVTEQLRLRRRRSEADTYQLIRYANHQNGKLGMIKELV